MRGGTVKHPNNLKRLREEQLLTQEGLFLRLHKEGVKISIRTLARYEAGECEPPLSIARVIADVLGLDTLDVWDE